MAKYINNRLRVIDNMVYGDTMTLSTIIQICAICGMVVSFVF